MCGMCRSSRTRSGRALEHRRRFAGIVGAVEPGEARPLEQALEQLDVGRLVVDDQDAGLLEALHLHRSRAATAHGAIESAFRIASAAGDSGQTTAGAAVYDACASARWKYDVCGRVEQQLQVVPGKNVELTEREREPHPHTGARRARREQRVDAAPAPRYAAAFSRYSREHAAVPPHEPRAGQQRAERAAPILDHDPDARVVEDQVAEDQQQRRRPRNSRAGSRTPCARP